MTSILTNTSAMVALQTLKDVSMGLEEVQGQIATGKKVENSVQDSSIWAITTVMQADVDGFNAVAESLSLGKATVSVARNAAEKVTDLLRDMKEKIVTAQGENIDRNKVQTDIDELKNQIDSIVSAAQFNGLNLIDGSSQDDVQILSSLDRAGFDVTASNITVERQDLATDSVVLGTETGNTVALDDANVTETVNSSATLLFADSANADDTEYEITIGGTSIGTVTNIDGEDVDVFAFRVAEFINDAGVEGIRAEHEGTAGTITISSEQGFDDIEFDMSVTATSAGNGTVDLNGGGAGATATTTLNPGFDTRTLSTDALGEYVLTVTGNAAGSSDFTIDFGGNALGPFTVTTVADADVEAGNIATAIDALGIADLSTEVVGNEVRITNAGAFTDLDVTITSVGTAAVGQSITLDDTGGTQLIDATSVANTTTEHAASEISGYAADITFTATAVAAGDSYSVLLRNTETDGSQTNVQFDYVAAEGDTLNDVALGLEEQILADSRFNNVSILVDTAADPVLEDVNIKIASTDTSITTQAAVTSATGGTAGGGLGKLATLDVTTNAGATQALTDIETLIQTAIDASAAFGSSENRIDIQSGFVSELTDSFTSGIGSLVDADMEAASAKLQALQVQQQLATQALSIANAAPQSILALFR